MRRCNAKELGTYKYVRTLYINIYSPMTIKRVLFIYCKVESYANKKDLKKMKIKITPLKLARETEHYQEINMKLLIVNVIHPLLLPRPDRVDIIRRTMCRQTRD